MPRKIKSRPKPVHNAPKGNSKPTGDKKIIVCHCWPDVYEAAHRILNDFTRKRLNGKKLSMSELINIIISHSHREIFGEFPNFDNEYSINSKGEN
ncbi:MAG: hypothetical protein IJP85_05700 [Synergistaceae bacterium]|nr:hypothetical protein [Synergistaceae bacterium]